MGDRGSKRDRNVRAGSAMSPRGLLCGLLVGLSVGSLSGCLSDRAEPVRIVGSSTIFPFAAQTAERYSDATGVVLVVEQTGSGGGHKLFCSGDPSIDATTSSRQRKPSEVALCDANGVRDVMELRLGFDGIVLARAAGASPPHVTNLDQTTLYRALARTLPVSDTDCTPVPNPNRSWRDLDPDLPDAAIEIYGPPPTSGTRDAFVETAMENGARGLPCLARMERDAPELFRARAHDLREDGAWIDAGENDATLVRTLIDTPRALGVFGFSFLGQNTDQLVGVSIDGVAPKQDSIRSGAYPVVRDLYLYLRANGDPDVIGYALEFMSEGAAGPGGYLESIGLIPLPAADRRDMRARIREAWTPASDRPQSADVPT